MRYRSNRQYLYPVLRPDSDDYGGAQLRTTLDQPDYDAELGRLNLSLRFDLQERSLISAVEAGDAKCSAMVYCRATLHRTRLESSSEEPFVARGSVPVSQLKNQVEIHPVILAARDLVHSPISTNPEDQGQSVEIRQWAPMATDRNWGFNLDSNDQPVRGIFRLVSDENSPLPDGQFDLRTEATKPYVDIVANPATIEAFKELRRTGGVSKTLPTIFTSAVIAVLAYIKDLGDDEDLESCEWVNCIRNKLHENGIRLGGLAEEGSHSLFLAAQLLLDSPFGEVMGDWVGETDDLPGDEED